MNDACVGCGIVGEVASSGSVRDRVFALPPSLPSTFPPSRGQKPHAPLPFPRKFFRCVKPSWAKALCYLGFRDAA